jgi:predicted GIY-YIG superfamily endonuclease
MPGSPAISRAAHFNIVKASSKDSPALWKRLVYYEHFDDIRDAIQREKLVKHWPRAWKIRLIHSVNPDWNDLYDTLI